MKTSSQQLKPLLKPLKSHKRNRVWEVDFLRGLCIFLMLLDHLMHNFMILPGMLVQGSWVEVSNDFFISANRVAVGYWTWSVREGIRFFVVFLFLFLSGISCSFSRSNTQRFLKMSAAAGIVMLVTYGLDLLFMSTNYRPNMFILFGILHIMALNIGIYVAIRFAFKDFTVIATGAIGLVFFVGGFFIPFWQIAGSIDGLIPFNTASADLRNWWWIAVISLAVIVVFFGLLFIKKILPRITKKVRCKRKKGIVELAAQYALIVFGAISVLLLLLNVPSQPVDSYTLRDFGGLLLGTMRVGSDFYGVFPYTGAFLLGATLGAIVYKRKRSLMPKVLNKNYNLAFSFVGRNAIWMYLAHQVVLFAAVVLGAMAVGYEFF